MASGIDVIQYFGSFPYSLICFGGAITFNITTFSIRTLSIRTFSIRTLSIRTTFSIRTISIMSLNIEKLLATFSINDNQHNNTQPLCCMSFAECRILFIVMLSVLC
jgi:hypothetical protein